MGDFGVATAGLNLDITFCLQTQLLGNGNISAMDLDVVAGLDVHFCGTDATANVADIVGIDCHQIAAGDGATVNDVVITADRDRCG